MKRIVLVLTIVSIVGAGSATLGPDTTGGARPASEVGVLPTDGRPAYLIRMDVDRSDRTTG